MSDNNCINDNALKREERISYLSKLNRIKAAHINNLDKLDIAIVADELWNKCDLSARNIILQRKTCYHT